MNRIVFIALALLVFVGCPSPEPPPPAASSVTVVFVLAENSPGPGLREATIARTGEKLYLHPEAVATNADIASADAVESPPMETESGRWEVLIAFLPKFETQFERITGHNIGKRIGVTIDGELITAPKIRDRIEGRAVVSGMWSKEEAERIARKIDPDAKTVPCRESESDHRFKRAEYTAEEYADLKVQREQMGMYHLDRVFTEAELSGMLTVGMSPEAVVAALGKPSWTSQDGAASFMTYQLAPEKRPVPPQYHTDSLTIDFVDGKLTAWRLGGNNMPRKDRPIYDEPSELQFTMPKVDFSSGEFDMVAYLEGLEIANPEHKMNFRDTNSILLLVSLTIGREPETGQPLSLAGDCDLMHLLEANFPEVANWQWIGRGEPGRGRVYLKQLRKLLRPYLDGEKPLPCISQ